MFGGWGQVRRLILSGCLLLFKLSSSPFSPTLFSSCLQLASQGPHSRETKSFVVGLEHLLGDIGEPFTESLGVKAWKLWLLPPAMPGVQLGALPLCRARLQSLPRFSVCYMEMAILFCFVFLLWLCLLSFSFYSLSVFAIWDDLKNELEVLFFVSFKYFLLL